MFIRKRRKEKKGPPGRRWTWLITSLAALALLTVFIALALFLLLRPYPLISKESFITSDTRLLGLVDIKPKGDTNFIIHRFLAYYNQRFRPQEAIEAKDINSLFKFLLYRQIYVVLNYNEELDPSILTVINIKRLGWLFSLITNIEKEGARGSRPAIIRVSDSPLWYCLTWQNLLLSNSKEEIAATYHSLKRNRAVGLSNNLLEKSRLIKGDHLFEGWLINKDNWLEKTAETYRVEYPNSLALAHFDACLKESDLSLADLNHIHIWADGRRPDSIDINISAEFVSLGSAKSWELAMIEGLLPTFKDSLPQGVKLSSSNIYQEDTSLTIELNLTGIKALIEAILPSK